MNDSTKNSKLKTQNYIEVSAGLVFRDGKLLIAQRFPGAHLGGLWEFPGGKRHDGELFEECLRRELREELAIEVEVRELVEDITHHYPDRSCHLKFFRCDWKSGEPQTFGCSAFAWVTAEQLCEYNFPDADSKLLKQLREDEKFWTR